MDVSRNPVLSKAIKSTIFKLINNALGTQANTQNGTIGANFTTFATIYRHHRYNAQTHASKMELRFLFNFLLSFDFVDGEREHPISTIRLQMIQAVSTCWVLLLNFGYRKSTLKEFKTFISISMLNAMPHSLSLTTVRMPFAVERQWIQTEYDPKRFQLVSQAICFQIFFISFSMPFYWVNTSKSIRLWTNVIITLSGMLCSVFSWFFCCFFLQILRTASARQSVLDASLSTNHQHENHTDDE